MRKLIVTLLFIITTLHIAYPVLANSSVIESTVSPFLAALSKGEIEAMLPYIKGDLLKKMEDAFSQDPEYGDFLERRYKKVSFSPVIIKESSGNFVVRVSMDFYENGWSSVDLYLEESSPGVWYIVGQYDAQ